MMNSTSLKTTLVALLAASSTSAMQLTALPPGYTSGGLITSMPPPTEPLGSNSATWSPCNRPIVTHYAEPSKNAIEPLVDVTELSYCEPHHFPAITSDKYTVTKSNCDTAVVDIVSNSAGTTITGKTPDADLTPCKFTVTANGGKP